MGSAILLKFSNSVPSEELKSYYLNADAFILASKFEGWGAVAVKTSTKKSQQHFVLFSAWLMLTVIFLQGLLIGAQGVVL